VRGSKTLAAVTAAVFDQVDAFLEVLAELDGPQRALILARGRWRLGRPVGAELSDPDEIPAPGCWELHGELEQLEQLVAVFKALRAPGRWQLIAEARAIKAAEPALPAGYSR
jgi:hypothetical protein